MRIIGGTFRGRKLIAAIEEITRPTSDRAKEGLFNVLESMLLRSDKKWHELTVVDVFAGSGAIGIEALSRGAKQAFFFEINGQAIKCLRQNIDCFDKDRVILHKDALKPVRQIQSVDIYFSDAPYNKGLTEKALMSFIQQGWISSQTIVILEADKGEKLILPDSFKVTRVLSYGRNQFYLGQILR